MRRRDLFALAGTVGVAVRADGEGAATKSVKCTADGTGELVVVRWALSRFG